MAEPSYHCPACGRNIAADRPRWRCDCGGPLDLAPGPGLSRHDIETGNASLWRYAAGLAMRALAARESGRRLDATRRARLGRRQGSF